MTIQNNTNEYPGVLPHIVSQDMVGPMSTKPQNFDIENWDRILLGCSQTASPNQSNLSTTNRKIVREGWKDSEVWRAWIAVVHTISMAWWWGCYTRVAPKLIPPIVLCWPMSEVDVGDMAVEVEPSCQYSVKFCCRASGDSRGAVWHGSAYEAKVCNWILPCRKNCTHWHSSMLVERLQRPNIGC